MARYPARSFASRPKVLVAASSLILVGLALSAFSLVFLRPATIEKAEILEAPILSCLTSDAEAKCNPEDSIGFTTSATAEEALVEEPVAVALSEPLVNLYSQHPLLDERIGTITLPSLGLSWPIFAGTTETQLSKGVGHFVGSVLPGIRDNSVLSGHRTSVFGRLGELQVADLLVVRTSAGDFTYRVREFRVVPRTDRTVIVPTPTAVLTLTTCYPFYSPVATTDAFIVSADLIDSKLNNQTVAD